MCLFTFGLHPGVPFNDGRIGHGLSLMQNLKIGRSERERQREREREREREGGREGVLAALHSNQFVMAVCIWTKVITI